MPYNSSGVFNPLITFVDNTPATAEDQNSQDVDIAGGLSECLTRSGLAPATAPISMGGFMINNLGVGVAPTDAVNLSQITGAYAPLAGATFTGAVHFNTTISVTGTATFGAATFSGAVAFSGVTTVPTVSTGDNSTNAASTANVTAKIAAQVANVPQPSTLTTGSGTYTTPAGATYIEVSMLGGGSGGGGSGSGSPGVGTAGGATTFGTMTAGGGPATPANTSTTYPTPATATSGGLNVSGGLGAAPGEVTGTTANNPGSGASSPLGQGGQPTSVSASGTIAASSATGFGAGGGAGGFGSGGSYNTGWAGNAGAYLTVIITSPASTYAYSVGAAGAAGAAGTGGATGSAGAGGLIRVIAHFQ